MNMRIGEWSLFRSLAKPSSLDIVPEYTGMRNLGTERLLPQLGNRSCSLCQSSSKGQLLSLPTLTILTERQMSDLIILMSPVFYACGTYFDNAGTIFKN